MSQPHIALNRFGLGARPGEARGLSDPRGWLLSQLDGGPPSLAGPAPDPSVAGRAFAEFRAALRGQDQDGVRAATRTVLRSGAAEQVTVLETRVVSDRPFVERWVDFWCNHLCVSLAAGIRTAAFAGRYEREVVRANALGRFEEMLLASARHPAMLLYLDNAQSVGPDSRAARRPRRRGGPGSENLRGLNENYARELLELHTLGVDGGYTQDDVRELARIFTGWTVRGIGGPMDRVEDRPGFRFLSIAHDPGRKTVLGKRYGEGEAAGREVIRDLARHPATARFVAVKLARHFIDDACPAQAVDALAARWMETDGDLREVARALVRLEVAWDPRHRKFRTPQDWLVAVLRAVNTREVGAPGVQILRQLRHPLWAAPSPAGYSDLRRDWGDSDSLMNRAELARTLATRVVGRRRLDPRPLASVLPLADGDPLPGLLADSSIDVPERVALALAGPAFQWR
jgi:uncharacterized protein (DUF1800 family)